VVQKVGPVTSTAYNGCQIESSLSLVANSNNQITTFSYDASGNTLNDTHNSYTWNAESEIQTAAGVTYTYDGDGDRLQKSSGKLYWYGAGTEILDESDSSGNFTDEYVYFGGKRVAHRVVSSNSIYYYGEDFLGTSRQIFTSASALCYDADFYPFGGERAYTNTCPPTYKFEGKERDTETSNDDFGARYYSSSFGRWTSPDWSAIPAPVPYANLTNPQTLNLYAMVQDNPETFADLDGHFALMKEDAVLPDIQQLIWEHPWGGVDAMRYRAEPWGHTEPDPPAEQHRTDEPLSSRRDAATHRKSDRRRRIGS
jgi:RHS repeat-associated protein